MQYFKTRDELSVLSTVSEISSPSLLVPVSGHLLDVVREPPVAVDVHYGDDFDEGDERETHGGVAVE